MRLVSTADAIAWCEDRGLSVIGDLPSDRLTFRNPEVFRFRLQVPNLATDVVTLAYVILMTEVPADEETQFEGGLLWLQDWDIWSETVERVGHMLLHRLRSREQSPSDLLALPAQLFEKAEFVEANSFLTLPLLFQWDAYFVPSVGNFAAFISHHGHVEIFSRGRLQHVRLLERFGRTTFRPEEIGEA